MSTLYPDQYDSFSTKVDNLSDVRSTDINDVQDSIVAIESELGPNVAGKNQPTGWTLADRLSVFVNDNGTFKASVLTSSDIPSGSISDTKIFHNDTFQFKSIKVGQHSGAYGYTGSGPGTNAGITIDENGNTLTDGNIGVLGVTNLNNTLNVNSNTNLGSIDTNLTTIRGTFLPQTTSKFDLGSTAKRFRSAYIDTLIGLSTGGETLTVATSAIFNTTLVIKAATDQSSGDSIAFIGANSGNLVIQAPAGYKTKINPYNSIGHSVDITENGDLQTRNIKLIDVTPVSSTQTIYSSGGGYLYWQDNPMNVDCYNFFVKYPYVADSIQEQPIGFSGNIISVVCSNSSSAAGLDITIGNDSSEVCIISDITDVSQKITNLSNITVVEGSILQLDITAIDTTSADLRVQVKVKRN